MNATVPDGPNRYRQLRELFDRAAERPATAWASFLERECPADSALVGEALRLLEHNRVAGTEGFLEPATPSTERSPMAATPGKPNPGSAEPTHVGKSQLSGYKSNRFNWLGNCSPESCDFSSLNACKIGVFSKSVRLRICKISLRLFSRASSFLAMATST
jgi:hypothetical protein